MRHGGGVEHYLKFNHYHRSVTSELSAVPTEPESPTDNTPKAVITLLVLVGFPLLSIINQRGSGGRQPPLQTPV
jgi:hypothetical protein